MATITNLFTKVDDNKRYRYLMDMLCDAVSFDVTTGKIGTLKLNTFDLENLLANIQLVKASTMSRLAKNLLFNSVPKVMVLTDKHPILNYLLSELSEFNPVELSPFLSTKTKNENLTLFREPASSCRVLVGMTSIMSYVGPIPCHILMMPNILANAEKFKTDGAIIKLVYGSDLAEKSIMESLASKLNILRNIPSYDDEIEN